MKRVDDLNWFLLDRCRHITRLNLGGEICSRSDYKMHLDILIKMQGTLRDLELSWLFDVRTVRIFQSSEDYAFPTDALHLKNLEVFTYSVNFDRIPAKPRRTIMSSWAAAIQGVKTMQLNCNCLEDYKFFECLRKCELPFPQLEAFINSDLTGQGVLDLLLKLTNPLKKLNLNALLFCEREDISKFETLIQKHAGTLEEFKFIYNGVNFISFGNATFHRLHLPILPRLKKFTVGWMPRTDLNIRFPSGHDNNDVVDYERHLPSLDALSLSMFPYDYEFNYTWEHQRDQLDNFFPTRDRNGEPIEIRCVTLRKLEPRMYDLCRGRDWSEIEFPSDLSLTDVPKRLE
ncbi:uncharacterized protein LOC118435953 isoform X1 [Folsomia candida]|nr:uncharacterized protein LOC118435953 isoform X1 [Folsomia candida]XP_035708403.1 uncharacterized protein LOC118435953 isoform X1 [Folsomia candida]